MKLYNVCTVQSLHCSIKSALYNMFTVYLIDRKCIHYVLLQ